jgi:hypothetical protein
MSISSLRRSLAAWVGGSEFLDARDAGQTLDWVLRMARRSCYDLLHAVDFIPRGGYERDFADRWRVAAERRLAIFASGNAAKDYRIRELHQLDAAEREVERLYALLDANGVVDPDDKRIPF